MEYICRVLCSGGRPLVELHRPLGGEGLSFYHHLLVYDYVLVTAWNRRSTNGEPLDGMSIEKRPRGNNNEEGQRGAA